LPVAVTVVNAPELGVVFPMGEGLASGRLVRFAALNTGAAENVGAAALPVKLPKTELATCVESTNVAAVVGVVVVKSGARADTLVTVPLLELHAIHEKFPDPSFERHPDPCVAGHL